MTIASSASSSTAEAPTRTSCGTAEGTATRPTRAPMSTDLMGASPGSRSSESGRIVGVAIQDGLEVGGVDRLAVYQEACDCLQGLPPPREDRAGLVQAFVEDTADLQVDLAGGLLAPGGVVGASSGREGAAALGLVADASQGR